MFLDSRLLIFQIGCMILAPGAGHYGRAEQGSCSAYWKLYKLDKTS